MILATPFPHWFALAAGAALALALGYGCARWIGPHGFMDHPGDRHGHDVPTPRTGGIALLLVITVGFLLGFRRLELRPEQWAGLVGLAVLGLLDDRWGLRARHKALGGLAIACLMAAPAAGRIVELQPQVQLLGGIPVPPVWPVAFLMLVLLYWFVPQALNLIDGANGLAIGYGLVVLGALAFAGHPLSYCAGALLGLLALNWPRSRHFLGDTGSLVLGLLLAMEVKRGVGMVDPNLVLWIFAYPILDVATVVAIRFLAGRSIGIGDRSHLHHQWIDRFPRWKQLVVPALWLQAGMCASAVVARGWGWLVPILGLSMLALQSLWFVLRSLPEPATDTLDLRTLQAVPAKDEEPGESPAGGGYFAA